jgi:hypothetical protein
VILRRKVPRDAIYLASYPKTGRTWLRFILANYINGLFQLGETIDFHTLFRLLPNDLSDAETGVGKFAYADDDRVPLILSSHVRYDKRFRGHPVLTIVRDPVDVLVSRYWHRARQLRMLPEKMTLSAFLRTENGVAHLIDYYDSWASHLESAAVLSYEGLHEHTVDEASRAVQYVGLPVDRAELERAVQASSFEQMRDLEVESGIPDHDYDRSDPNARRVRRGEVGSGRGEIDGNDVGFVLEELERGLDTTAYSLIVREASR